jgi:ribosomal protein S4
MRFVNKYKGYEKATIIFERFPLRVLKFKRPKWKKVQKLILYRKKSRVVKKNRLKLKKLFREPANRLFDTFVNYLDPYTWDRIKKYYENGRRIRTSILKLFDKTLVAKSFKKFLRRSNNSFLAIDVYLKMIVRPEYRLDILIWRLGFFRSSYQACQAINEKRVYVNDRCVGKSTLLRKGDVITFSLSYKQSNFVIQRVKDSFLEPQSVLTFLEVDYYSNSIVVVKGLSDLSTEDLYLMAKDYYSLKKLSDCL